MNFADKLLADSYPAMLIEKWTGHDGWPCYRVFGCSDAQATPCWDKNEYQTLADATEAAARLGEHIFPDGYKIVVMPGDNNG